MNYKIAKTMLGLCVGYLAIFYVLKFFFPELLLQVIASPTLIRLGKVISIWVGFEYFVRMLSNFIVFYLFACASTGKFKFKIRDFAIIIAFVIISTLILDFLPELYTHTSICLMFITALICKGKLVYATISFTIHGYLSQFLASIRGFETIFMHINPVSGLLLNLESFVWLILLGAIFYFKENSYGSVCTTLSQQEQEVNREETL
jgi:hypothetical protein